MRACVHVSILYVSMYVFLNVCRFVCVCVRVRACVLACVRACKYTVCKHVCIFECMQVCVCVRVCACMQSKIICIIYLPHCHPSFPHFFLSLSPSPMIALSNQLIHHIFTFSLFNPSEFPTVDAIFIPPSSILHFPSLPPSLSPHLHRHSPP